MDQLITPHGGYLKDCLLTESQLSEYQSELHTMPSWYLSSRQLCDVELLLCGGFSPLQGFMNQADYHSTLNNMRLADGTLWPMPITLDVTEKFAETLAIGHKIALRDQTGILIAILAITSVFHPDKTQEAIQVFGSDDITHPGIHYLLHLAGSVYIGGDLFGATLPTHDDFTHLRHTPAQLRREFTNRHWQNIVAFQTRNPMHRAHQALTLRAAQQHQANLLIQPVVGLTKPGDIDHYTRVRCYQKLLAHYPAQTTLLSLLPLAMRMAGPKEALWHAIIRKNYGCNYFIVGRDHAGPGKNRHGEDFYGPYDAQALVAAHAKALEITIVPFQEMVYVKNNNTYCPVDQVSQKQTVLRISGTELRRRLQQGLNIPTWFSYPDIIEELRRTYPPRDKQGFTIFFTGLSGAGKSTIANTLMIKLMEIGNRRITLLDGDIVRMHLSSELGFSKQHRDLNIKRLGYVASEITKNGGIAICAAIAPYQQARREVRDLICSLGGFIEVYIATPLSVCEQRDRKGLYAKARAGALSKFTGISDPYETPLNPELIINTENCTPQTAVQQILSTLKNLGYLSSC